MSDIRTSAYTTGVIHTHSGFAKGNIDKVNLRSLSHSSTQSKISQLEAKEEELYKKFGEQNYQGFIQKIRRFFYEPDRQVIQRFEANSLSKELEKFSSQNGELLNQQVSITINTSKLGKKFKIDKNQILSFQTDSFNPKVIKEFLNKNFKTGLLPSSLNMEKTDEILSEMGDAVEIKIGTKDKSTGKIEWELFQRSRIQNYPWGVSKADIEAAEDLGIQKEVREEIRQDLEKAIQRIKNFVYYELGQGATPKLQKAILQVWNRNFGTKWSDPLAFFKGTKEKNFISAIQGSLGEFQAALIFEYLRAENTSGAALSMIQGNLYKKGEQGKTDVQIFKSLGLQVKNVTTITKDSKMSMIRDLETNIHPSKFAKYLEDGVGITLLDFLANYYFNLSYQESMDSLGRKQELEENLSNWLIEIMNMAMVDSQVMDTVNFYLIGGKYLVPASAIIKASDELKLSDSIQITSAYQGKTDEDFASEENDPPLYETYWTLGEDDEWSHTGKNTNIYYQLINKKISIRTHFNLIETIEDYALFSKF